MNVPSLLAQRSVRPLSILHALVMVFSASLIAGCGSGMTPPPKPTPSFTGTTSVTVVLSSTANGQFSAFPITLNSISLTNSAGQTVSLLETPQMAEFIHLNGHSAPSVTAAIPQGVYTSANVMYSDPRFTYITVNATGGIVFATDANGSVNQTATVSAPFPITISGDAMGVVLDLQVSKSATCVCGSTPGAYTINPVFSLKPVAISSQASNQGNGKFTGMNGRVVSVNTGSNSVSLATNNGWSFPPLANGPTVPVTVNGSTVYQGVSGLAAVNAGMFVELDTAIQSDGSLLATRVEVQDPAALNVMIGPMAQVDQTNGIILEFGRQQQGDDLSVNPIVFEYYSFGAGTVFRTSGRFASPQNLPFTPTFNGASIVAGQNVSVAFAAQSMFGGTRTAANTITLLPQTINGTVSAVSTSGSFTVYRVTLPAYDFIPTLNGATSVMAYVDANTQMFNSLPLGVGSQLRFNGFLFNDAGTLRMVAVQVNDGVPQ